MADFLNHIVSIVSSVSENAALMTSESAHTCIIKLDMDCVRQLMSSKEADATMQKDITQAIHDYLDYAYENHQQSLEENATQNQTEHEKNISMLISAKLSLYSHPTNEPLAEQRPIDQSYLSIEKLTALTKDYANRVCLDDERKHFSSESLRTAITHAVYCYRIARFFTVLAKLEFSYLQKNNSSDKICHANLWRGLTSHFLKEMNLTTLNDFAHAFKHSFVNQLQNMQVNDKHLAIKLLKLFKQSDFTKLTLYQQLQSENQTLNAEIENNKQERMTHTFDVNACFDSIIHYLTLFKQVYPDYVTDSSNVFLQDALKGFVMSAGRYAADLRDAHSSYWNGLSLQTKSTLVKLINHRNEAAHVIERVDITHSKLTAIYNTDLKVFSNTISFAMKK